MYSGSLFRFIVGYPPISKENPLFLKANPPNLSYLTDFPLILENILYGLDQFFRLADLSMVNSGA